MTRKQLIDKGREAVAAASDYSVKELRKADADARAEALRDALTNIRHWADEAGADWTAGLDTLHYEAERSQRIDAELIA